MTREEALVIVARYPLGATFGTQYQKCRDACCRAPGARGHGPNWYARVRLPSGQTTRLYIGTDAKKARIDQAHALLGGERERLQARIQARVEARIRAIGQSQDARALAELERVLLMPEPPTKARRRRALHATADVVEIPILDLLDLPRRDPAA